jgi:NADP-dependent 3-hydroxy acid dehydrogenase YdfG
MLEVNVLALCVCTALALEDLERRGVDGHIIHVSSMSGHRVVPGSGVYAASKFAVRGLTEGLRQELRAAGSGTRVTAISPGVVETGFAAHYHQSEARARETYQRFPPLQAEDVAGAVRYALGCPPHMEVHDVLVRPTAQSS